MRWIALIFVSLLAGCVTTTEGSAPQQPAPQQQAARKAPSTPTDAQVARFRQVVARVEPVAERFCRDRRQNTNCDFNIVIDRRPNQPANAYQTLDKNGRPILAFNLAILADMRNSDEIAFVLSHEAAHHIAGHIPRQRQNATAGAIILGGLATLAGAGSGAVDAAANVGATVGARTYSKDFELEADALGTVISRRSGYNPVRGAEFFNRIPDPGDRFLGTHPPNAERIQTVRRVNSQL
ncbi:MAG: M48 family metallopeptidase [Pseudomonadota bacterium]